MKRRNILRLSCLVGATAALPSAAKESNQNRSEQNSDSPYLMGGGSVTPMNAANLCPALRPAFEAQVEYARTLIEDVSLITRLDFAKEKIKASRNKVAEMLGVSDASSIAFVRNTSEANSSIINGMNLRPEDEVISWSENHATNRHTWLYRRKRTPFQYKEIQIPRDLNTSDEIVERFVAALSKNTRAVTFSHISNISGTRMPAKLICKAVRDYNPDIHIHLDGAQSWGSIEVNLDDIDCDSYSSSGHKFFMGPRGTGILYVKENRVQDFDPNILGYNFLLEYPLKKLATTAERFECLGQRDTAAYAAISDTIDARRAAFGSNKTIEERTQHLTQYTLKMFENEGIEVKTNTNEGMAHGAVIADLGGKINTYGAFLALHNDGIAAAFVSGDKVCCMPDEEAINENLPTYLRLSPHVYNSEDQINRAIAIVKRVYESKFEIIKEAIRFI